MAQTTTAVNGAAATISIKVASAAYADISGSSQSVDAVTATVVTGEAYTFDGSYAILTTGKFEPVEVKVNIIYTETAAEAFIVAQAAFVAKSKAWQAAPSLRSTTQPSTLHPLARSWSASPCGHPASRTPSPHSLSGGAHVGHPCA